MTTVTVEVAGFQSHKCVDCGEQLKKFGAVRCLVCNASSWKGEPERTAMKAFQKVAEVT